MTTNQRIILVAYIDVSSVPSEDRMVYIERAKSALAPNKDKDTTFFFIPTDAGGSRIECIYPNYLIVDSTAQKESVDRLLTSLETIAKNFPYLTNGTEDLVP